ncbi:MAG: hypothetical protein L0387_38700 [Acidobacteria bacterium]|nr:hypothetical protein [Acidobacteriota bacterium]MCI0724853.1 hypothetical protein [Acidobacteriota bacterium]
MTEQRAPDENRLRSRHALVASLAAVGSIVIGSSCCLPLLPFLFAAGAASSATLFATVRPVLLVVASLSLGYGFYQARRARQCQSRLTLLSAFLLWSALAIVAVSIFFPQVVANALADLLAR